MTKLQKLKNFHFRVRRLVRDDPLDAEAACGQEGLEQFLRQIGRQIGE